MDRLFFTLGSLSGFLAVALGAFGAHALKTRRVGPGIAELVLALQGTATLHPTVLPLTQVNASSGAAHRLGFARGTHSSRRFVAA